MRAAAARWLGAFRLLASEDPTPPVETVTVDSDTITADSTTVTADGNES